MIEVTSVLVHVIRAREVLHTQGLHPTPQADPVDSTHVW